MVCGKRHTFGLGLQNLLAFRALSLSFKIRVTMSPVILLTLFFAGCAFGSPLANQYFDSVLNVALPNQVRSLQMDPATVPDFSVEFVDKVKIIGKVKGKAEFFKGQLTGLAKATRYSECQGPSYSFGAKSVNCTIGFNDLSINYEGKLKYGKMPKVNIKGKSNVTSTQLFVEVTQNQAMPPTIKNFMFQNVGYLQVKFTGLGPLNRFTKFLEDGFKSHVQAEIFNSMSQRLKYAFERAVAQTPLPM